MLPDLLPFRSSRPPCFTNNQQRSRYFFLKSKRIEFIGRYLILILRILCSLEHIAWRRGFATYIAWNVPARR